MNIAIGPIDWGGKEQKFQRLGFETRKFQLHQLISVNHTFSFIKMKSPTPPLTAWWAHFCWHIVETIVVLKVFRNPALHRSSVHVTLILGSSLRRWCSLVKKSPLRAPKVHLLEGGVLHRESKEKEAPTWVFHGSEGLTVIIRVMEISTFLSANNCKGGAGARKS